jgi:DNA-binding response OmpR family regulator
VILVAVKVFILTSDVHAREPLARAFSSVARTAVDIQDPANLDITDFAGGGRPDVVLVDLDQSSGRGLEIIRQLNGSCQGHPPVIMAIAEAPSLSSRASSLEAGAMFVFDTSTEQGWLLESLASIKSEIGTEEEDGSWQA